MSIRNKLIILLFCGFLIFSTKPVVADVILGIGFNLGTEGGEIVEPTTGNITAPTITNIPTTSTTPLIQIAGIASTPATKVKLYVNSLEINTVDIIADSFTFNDVFLDNPTNNISVVALDEEGHVSTPNTATVYFNNYEQLLANLDLIDYTIKDWDSWGYVNGIASTEGSNKNLIVTQDFNYDPPDHNNWGGIIHKTIPDFQQDLSQFKKVYYTIKNDGQHPEVTVKLGFYEASGELWQEKTARSLSGTWKTFTVYLNTANLQLIEDDYNKKVNGVLDLQKITRVAIFINRNNGQGTHVLYLDDIKASKSIVPAPSITTDEIYTSKNSCIISGTKTKEVKAIKIISDTSLNATVTYHSDTSWTANITNLTEGNNNLLFSSVTLDGSESEPTYCTVIYDKTAPVKPTLLLDSGVTYVKSLVVNGYSYDTDLAQVDLYINDKKVSSVTDFTFSDTYGYYEFNFTAELKVTDNIITAKSIDKAGNISAFTDPITLKLSPKQYDFTIAGLNQSIKLVFPIGATQSLEDPQFILLKPNPEVTVPVLLLQSLPTGRTLHDNYVQIIDINLPETLLKPITISVPINKATNVEPWYWDEISQVWTQKGIQSWKIDTVENTVISDGHIIAEKQYYLTFIVSHLSIFGIFEKTDLDAPQISNITFDSKVIEENDYVKADSLFTAKLSDNLTTDSGVASYNIKVLDPDTLIVLNTLKSEIFTTPKKEYSITPFRLNLESNKKYKLQISATDAVGNLATSITPKFEVTAKFAISNCLNGPNPFNPYKVSTNLQYQLSQDANVKILIYTISGQQVFKTECKLGETGGTAGFNNITWDGKDKNGEVVANGVYIAYLIANNANGTQVGKIKIAVLK